MQDMSHQQKTVSLSRDRQECFQVLGGPNCCMREKGSVCRDSPGHPTPKRPLILDARSIPDATDEWMARSRSPLRRPCDMHDLANQNPTRRRRRPSDQSAADSNGGVCLWYLRHAIRLGLDICTIGGGRAMCASTLSSYLDGFTVWPTRVRCF